MCFSAGASFGAGIVLSSLGVISMKKAVSPSQKAFASIPFIFAIQQTTEGFLWLALCHSEFQVLRWPATYLFLFFAQVVWPFWVPFSVRKLEKNTKRKEILSLLVGIGALVSSYLAYCLLSFPVAARIDGSHIHYQLEYPEALSKYGSLFYVIATIAPPFFSKVKYMWSLGLAILISYILSELFYTNYIVSVWCFFAAVISVALFAIIRQLSTAEKHKASLQPADGI